MEIKKTSKPWALILGASRGLGLASALELACLGYPLILVHRDPRSEKKEFDQQTQELKSQGVAVLSFNKDATRQEAIAALITEIKAQIEPDARIGVLLHSIAKGHVKPLIDKDETQLSATDLAITLEAMAGSLMSWTQQLHADGLFADDTRIISFTSEGSHRAWKHYAAVGAAKAALESLTRSIALEFAPYGIRANCIQAGVVDTQSLRRIQGVEQILKFAAARSPVGRITTPEDVAKVVGLLCSPQAAWINGAIIPVDGGAHIQ